MMFLKLDFFLILKKGTHIYDLYYCKNNILKKEKPYIHFLVWGDCLNLCLKFSDNPYLIPIQL
jgi:hypothetical protein